MVAGSLKSKPLAKKNCISRTTERLTLLDPATENARVQTARGLACLLLVAYHVIGNDINNGLNLAQDSIYRMATLLFEHLRMPLFSFLSGFVYAYRPATPSNRMKFVQNKVLRILLPMVIVSTLHFAAQSIAPGVNAQTDWSSVWKIYLLPFQHYWFLQAIMLIFVGTVFVEPFLKHPSSFAIVFAAALAAHFSLKFSKDLFSIHGALYLLPFFLFGIAINRYRPLLSGNFPRFFGIFALLTLWAWYAIICLTDPNSAPQKSTLMATILSLASCYVVIQSLRPMSILASIGTFSFSIYLYHVFFTSAIRTTLRAVGIQLVVPHILAGLFAGIVGPVLFEIFASNHPIGRKFFLGKR